jgi:hypothetical protein
MDIQCLKTINQTTTGAARNSAEGFQKLPESGHDFRIHHETRVKKE